MKSSQFNQAVIAWFKVHGRKDLPWQQNISPYSVWVSEIMLQQTQVNTVIPYYLKFIQQFPCLDDLATATEDQVMALWSGLGYYSRARNLHKTAKLLAAENSTLPKTQQALEDLPGIGRSTAGAILSLSMDKNAAILDGNVKRVLARHFQVTGWPGNGSVLKELWGLAESLTPKKDCKDYTQAMMDIGATLCTRSKPKCPECPLVSSCLAFKAGDQIAYPGNKPKKKLPVKAEYFFLLRSNTELLMHKRPGVGIWGGLWTPASLAAESEALTLESAELKQLIENQLGLSISKPKLLNSFRHTFSHFHLEITPVIAHVSKFKAVQDNGLKSASTEHWLQQGIPAAVRTMILNLENEPRE